MTRVDHIILVVQGVQFVEQVVDLAFRDIELLLGLLRAGRRVLLQNPRRKNFLFGKSW